MLRFLFGFFIILHGLVHLWYVTLSQRWVEFQPEMGWSGQSWLLMNRLGETPLRSLASALYVLAAVLFVAAGAGIFLRAGWWRPVLIGSAAFSSVVILLFWDGRPELLVQKGLIGLLINMIILVALLVLQ
jgi:hypothetical protein